MKVIPQLGAASHYDRLEILARLDDYLLDDPIPGQLALDLDLSCPHPGLSSGCAECPEGWPCPVSHVR